MSQFTPAGSGGAEISVTTGGAVTPTITNVTVAADTEYSHALPSGTRKYLLRFRGHGRMQMAYTSGETDTEYITIPAGTTRWVENLRITALTLYFRVSKAGVVEIETWS